MQQQASQYDSLYTQSMRTLQTCQDNNKRLSKEKSVLQDTANYMKLTLTATQENNSSLRKQLQSISAISTAQAESIKKSLDNMGAKDTYIMALHSAVARRDSANIALVLELKAAIGGYSDQGLAIKLENGVVHLDIKDSLLFGGDTTSYTVTDPAKQILSRLARVLNDQPAVEFIIEAHTDTLSDAQDSVMDSWDLSAKRATSIARLMQKQYHVAPARITAAGRGEFATAANSAAVPTSATVPATENSAAANSTVPAVPPATAATITQPTTDSTAANATATTTPTPTQAATSPPPPAETINHTTRIIFLPQQADLLHLLDQKTINK